MSDNADRGYRYFVGEAEKLTGITQQQVSKWNAALEDIPRTRATPRHTRPCCAQSRRPGIRYSNNVCHLRAPRGPLLHAAAPGDTSIA